MTAKDLGREYAAAKPGSLATPYILATYAWDKHKLKLGIETYANALRQLCVRHTYRGQVYQMMLIPRSAKLRQGSLPLGGI